MTHLLSAIARRATARAVLGSFVATSALLLTENCLDLPPGVPYMRRITHGRNFLDLGFSPAGGAHSLLSALGPAGRETQALLLVSMDLLIPFACAAFGALALAGLNRARSREPNAKTALVLVPILAAALDYAENLSILGLLQTFPRDPRWLSVLTHALTTLKFICYAASALLLLVGVVRVGLARRVRTSSATRP